MDPDDELKVDDIDFVQIELDEVNEPDYVETNREFLGAPGDVEPISDNTFSPVKDLFDELGLGERQPIVSEMDAEF